MILLKKLYANLPGHSTMSSLHAVWERAVRCANPADRFNEFDDLRVDLSLGQDGEPLVFDGCESTYYLGSARGLLVFAIVLCDDVPHWLGKLLGVDAEAEQMAGRLPGTNEAVYIIAPNTSGLLVDAYLAMPDGAVGTWDAQRYWPQTADELTPLLLEAGL